MSETKRKIVDISGSIPELRARLPDVHTLIMVRIRRSRERKNRKGRIKIKRCTENL